MADANLPFIRNLASSDRKLRTSSLTSLHAFLSSRQPPHNTLSTTDALKLWKGLFYAMWMCDRPIPQQNLAAELANLLAPSTTTKASSQSSSSQSSSAGAVHPDCADAWMSAFWQVHAAEWTTGIDVLRMEKFLLLVRRFLCASFSWVRASAYDPARARALLSVLADWPLTTERGLDAVPLGLRLHVLDIWVDELERAGVLADATGGGDDDENDETSPVDPEKATALIDGVGALVRILTKDVPSKPLRTKAANSLDDERLPWYKAPSAEDEEGDDDGWAGFQD